MSSILLSLHSADETDFAISDEIVFTPLAQEGSVNWFLCRHASSGETFVLATAANEEALFQVTQRLKNEFSLRNTLYLKAGRLSL
ncbi:hypothetical protein [Pantoea sp. MQR6]|uniref:hypothetical protein n=1 Tax=Pantoea sp. MQR6 TaxID=2907307 RepID=UPI00325C0A2E